ncbi:MAG TPA: hypothetical protein IAB52_04210 [Candidatus Scatomonas merdavium]|nr:hypothetical protein [Candidatus Scatomonas merdavium]
MSQEKVNRYKKDKANRQKIMKREKIIRRLEITIAAVVVVGLLIWFGTAVYQNSVAVAEDNADTVTTSLDVSAMDEYLTGLTTSSSSAE